jgi:hypothetical protein
MAAARVPTPANDIDTAEDEEPLRGEALSSVQPALHYD